MILAAVLLVTAGMRLDYINSERYRMKLIINEPLKNAPPSLAFATVAMGAFRGLVVDILWIRADKLKEQGQFFDAKQLAEWITILQPRFAKVWEFQAWNMAYNISVAIPATEPQQRWRWVRNGYELLRDKGIEMNPKSIRLYQELARIFRHKIGTESDDVHKYYKLQLVKAMEPLLGNANNQTFAALAKVPANFQEIIEDTDIAQIVTDLKSADPAFADDSLFVSNYLSLRQNPGRFNSEAFRVIDNYRADAALGKLDFFARAGQLRNVWKLDPVLMQQLNQTYGPVDLDDPNTHLPLDWRHPDTHAIYWAVKGLKMAGRKEYSVDETNTDRIVNHSLQNLFRNGMIFVHNVKLPSIPDQTQMPAQDIFLRPDLRMFEPYNEAVLAVIEKYKDIRKKETLQSLKNGHRNMLINAAFSFYQAGHIRRAQEIYSRLKQLYPQDEFNVSFVTFMWKRLQKELDGLSITNAKEIVQLMLREAYFRYAVRDDDEAFGREKMAEEIHKQYQSMYTDENRIDLPDFKLLKYLALMDFLNDHHYLDLRESLLARIKIERPDLAEQLQKAQQKILEQMKESEQTQ